MSYSKSSEFPLFIWCSSKNDKSFTEIKRIASNENTGIGTQILYLKNFYLFMGKSINLSDPFL
jgi:hypothetical protein